MKKFFTNNPETIIILIIILLVMVGIALGILPSPIEPESGLLLMGLIPLLPCPFCGGKAWLRAEGHGTVSHAWIACENCGMETKHYPGPGADETACNLWNSRLKQTQLPIHQAIHKFAELLTDGAGQLFLNKAGLHEDSLADFKKHGFTEDEYRVSIAGFALDALRAKFQEIVEPALQPVAVSELDHIMAELKAAREFLVWFRTAKALAALENLMATLKTAQAGTLVLEAGSDPTAYTLREGADAGQGAWIRFKNIDVRVYQGDEGVSVDLYSVNSPETDALASTFLTFAEAAEESEQP